MEDLRSVVILGRQPALGLAELESLFGGDTVMPISEQAAALKLPADEIDFQRLGGSVKLCKLLTILDTVNWGDIERFLVKNTPGQAAPLPEGKLQFGLSAYGFNESAQRIQATGLSVKKAIKKSGRSIRLVPNPEPALNSAQVLHNKLTGGLGWELVVVAADGKTFLAQTTASQDIDSYTLRDRGRPKRDTRVGMLPPKLAQILINLAGKHVLPADAIIDPEHPANKTPRNALLLDPFCGTGVVLQEALLMGYDVYGTDLEPRMIDYSGENLDWLAEQFDLQGREMRIESGDATMHTWEPAPDVVACETYLGRPFTATPSRELLEKNAADCNQIIRKFLANVHDQLAPGARLCLAIPAWQTGPDTFKHLPLTGRLIELGYRRVNFEHIQAADLLYYRPDQLVARELLVLSIE